LRSREPRPWLVVQFDAHVASERALEEPIEPHHPDAPHHARARLVEDHVAVALAVEIGVVDLQREDAADGQQRRAVGTDPEVEVPAGAIGARDLRDARSGGAR
jgi:hypothetical protein